MSLPAQNTSPLAPNTTTRTLGSVSAVRHALARAAYISMVTEFFLSGRLKRTVMTLSVMFVRICVVIGAIPSVRVAGFVLSAIGGHLAQAQAQGVEFDEALRVILVVDRILLEGHEVHAIEGIGRLAPNHGARAFVEFQAHHAVDPRLGFVDGGLEHLPFRREPIAG